MPMDQFLEQMRKNSLTDDLDLAGSDDEHYSDDQEFIDSPIKDDQFEGKVEEDPPLIQSDAEEPDFSKMNSSFGSSKKKEIDLRKGITIEKNQKKPLDNIVQHSQSHFDGVQGML